MILHPRHWGRDPLVRAGLLLLAVQTVWRGAIAFDSYFWQDDFVFLSAVNHEGLTVDLLLQRWNGHLVPAKYVMAALVAPAGPDYGPAAMSIIALGAIASGLMLWMLCLLFPGRRLLLVAYAAYLFTPLGLVGVTWWTFAMEGLPMQVAMFGVTGSYLAWRRSRAHRWVWTGLAALALGLAFWEKSILAVVFAVGVAALVVDATASVRSRLVALWQSERGFWLPQAVVVIGYAAAYVTERAARSSSAVVDGPQFVTDAVGRTLLTGLVGGPWTDTGADNTLFGVPASWALVLTVVGWVWLIAWTVRSRGPAAIRAWTLALAYLALALGLVLWQRAGLSNFLARDPRYVLDAVPVVLVAMMGALVPGPRSQGTEPSTADGDAVTLVEERYTPILVVALLASAWVSTTALLPTLQHGYSRSFVASLEDSLATEQDVSIVDAPAPPTQVLIQPVSVVFSAMGFPAVWNQPSTDLRIVDGLGRLASVDIPRPSFQQRGPDGGCWLVGGDRPALKLTTSVTAPGRVQVLRIGYIAENPVELTVQVDGQQARLSTVDRVGHAFLVVRSARTMSVDAIGGRPACVSDVAIGDPWPSP